MTDQQSEMVVRWITLDVERVLYVHRGRETILCDREHPGAVTLVLQVTDGALTRALTAPAE